MRIQYVIALALPLAAAACSSHEQFPASPIPGALNDRQAVSLASAHVNEKVVEPRMLTRLERQRDGYLIGYRTMFEARRKPPVEALLVEVHNDGTVRDWTFTAGD